MRILISGGKTGGHLIPGIAVYEEARRREHTVFYFLGPNDDQFAVTKRINMDHRYVVPLGSLSRKLSWKTPLWLWNIFRAFLVTVREIKRLAPDGVIITGGYISNPVALSAVVLGIPLFILEQNTVAGITNRFFAPFAKQIFTSFPTTEKIPLHKTTFTGNPSLFSQPLPRLEAREFFSLPSDTSCLGVVGGSQGAKKLNEGILSLLPLLKKRDIAVIWSMGKGDYQQCENDGMLSRLQNDYPLVRIFPFIERMDAFWGACDGVIARSGATTVTEVIASRCPALFIPIYRSPDDHQKKNALFLVSCGAADILEEPFLHHIEEKVEHFLATLHQKRLILENLSLSSSFPQKRILDAIEGIIKHRRGL